MSDAAVVSPERLTEIQAREAKKFALKIEGIKKHVAKRYPHALPETVEYVPAKNKFRCQIRCVVTGEVGRWVYTSDLHQVTMCEEASVAAKGLKKEVKKAELKKALELVRAGKVKAEDVMDSVADVESEPGQ